MFYDKNMACIKYVSECGNLIANVYEQKIEVKNNSAVGVWYNVVDYKNNRILVIQTAGEVNRIHCNTKLLDNRPNYFWPKTCLTDINALSNMMASLCNHPVKFYRPCNTKSSRNV